jgi:hypothetical protein
LVSTTTKTKPIIENNSVKNNSVVKEKEAGKEIVVEKKETTPVKIIEPETVQVIEAKPEPIKEANVLTEEKSKNEVAIESLELVNTKGGKASTFFSGPRGGKYYVVTNLVKRGQLVKVTNTSNGKFVMAEVLGPLPVHDLSKGLILKIGDNAKSILGISTATFNVKVNY